MNIKRMFFAQKSFRMQGIGIGLLEKNLETGKYSHASDIIIDPHAEATEIPTLLWLNDDEARRFMDELWFSGVRPSPELLHKATDEHLQDMRKITFAALKKEGIECAY